MGRKAGWLTWVSGGNLQESFQTVAFFHRVPNDRGVGAGRGAESESDLISLAQRPPFSCS